MNTEPSTLPIPKEEDLVPSTPTTPITRKQRRFIEAYTNDPFRNATEAAKKAGYSSTRAAKSGYALLQKEHIAYAVKQMEDAIKERNAVTTDYFISKLRTIVDTSDAKYSEQISALALLAKITGHIKDTKNIDTKQTVIFSAFGLEDESTQ